MPDRSDVIYLYDGSFDGLMCCIFESYEKNEIPKDICVLDGLQTSFLPTKEIQTEAEKAQRVIRSIPKKMGDSVLEFVRHSFLTCHPQKELYILLFLRKGYQFGPSVLNMLADETVHSLFKAVNHLKRESHSYMGFIRFSDHGKILIAEIEPKNYVLPLLTKHFCERYPEECFLIHDKTHHMALVYQPGKWAVVPALGLNLPEPDEEEEVFRALWQHFYDAIAIEERHNPRCRMNHMPKRYWREMTEFQRAVGRKKSSLPTANLNKQLPEK